MRVAPARLERWITGFAERHGTPRAGAVPAERARAHPGTRVLRLSAADGAVADLYPAPGVPSATGDVDDFVAAALAPRRLGLLLARQGAAAVGVAFGDALEKSKVETSYVQGRTAAGGWSQQRYARRRANQAKSAAASAAAAAAALLLPVVVRLDAVVTGGDRRAVRAVLDEPRLAPVAAVVAARFLEVARPRRAALVEAVVAARATDIWIMDPIDGTPE